MRCPLTAFHKKGKLVTASRGSAFQHESTVSCEVSECTVTIKETSVQVATLPTLRCLGATPTILRCTLHLSQTALPFTETLHIPLHLVMVMGNAMDMVMATDMIMATDMGTRMAMNNAMDTDTRTSIRKRTRTSTSTKMDTNMASVIRKEKTPMGLPAAPAAAVILTR
ncbi:uncharacterized protein LOC101160273 [Oryzias latipes]|uniref:uncharacterized protein LOC101160273 n=1 Tax=Oryzias latipes TaxID=8090 RepID=UPI0005CC377F|nr:uncharacterized protein LOC101160273 [Oryzias latipes]